MARFWTSDWHLGHAAIIGYCSRPFTSFSSATLKGATDTEAMNAAIISAVNSVVAEEDELWVLGDVALGDLNHNISLRKGIAAKRVVLVPGNHDRCHPMHAKDGNSESWTNRYRDAGWDVQSPQISVKLGGHIETTVSHFPYHGEPREGRADRYPQWRPQDDGNWLICGHVHTAWRQNGRMINVGIDAWGGSVVPEWALINLIEQGQQHLSSLPWGKSASAITPYLAAAT